MGNTEVEIAIAAGAFLGAVLGRSFKVLVLIPAGLLTIALCLVKGEFSKHTALDSFLGIALTVLSLELGYVGGLISTDVSAAGQGFRRALTNSRRLVPSRPKPQR